MMRLLKILKTLATGALLTMGSFFPGSGVTAAERVIVNPDGSIDPNPHRDPLWLQINNTYDGWMTYPNKERPLLLGLPADVKQLTIPGCEAFDFDGGDEGDPDVVVLGEWHAFRGQTAKCLDALTGYYKAQSPSGSPDTHRVLLEGEYSRGEVGEIPCDQPPHLVQKRSGRTCYGWENGLFRIAKERIDSEFEFRNRLLEGYREIRPMLQSKLPNLDPLALDLLVLKYQSDKLKSSYEKGLKLAQKLGIKVVDDPYETYIKYKTTSPKNLKKLQESGVMALLLIFNYFSKIKHELIIQHKANTSDTPFALSLANAMTCVDNLVPIQNSSISTEVNGLKGWGCYKKMHEIHTFIRTGYLLKAVLDSAKWPGITFVIVGAGHVSKIDGHIKESSGENKDYFNAGLDTAGLRYFTLRMNPNRVPPEDMQAALESGDFATVLNK